MTLAYDMERVCLIAQEMVSAIEQLQTHKDLGEYVSWSLSILRRQCENTSRCIEAHRGKEEGCDSRD